MLNRKSAFISAFILVVLGVCSFLFLKPYIWTYEVSVETPYPGDTDMWNNIFKQGLDGYEFSAKPFGVILPHHMIVSYELAKFYDGLSKVSNPKTFVIIGPNHYETGVYNAQTCENCVYKTTEGNLEVNENLVEKMKDEKIVNVADENFVNEHSISSHAAFIKHYFPEAKIVPIILQWKMPIEEVAAISSWLDKNLSPDAIVVASVDFSHYLREGAAEFHDQSSAATINNFDFKNIYDLEIDSPSSIYLLLDLMQKRGFGSAKKFANTNSQNYLEEKLDKTTSHQFWGFFDGEGEKIKSLSFLSFGNIPQNDLFGLIDNWNWNRNYAEESDTSIFKMFKNIKGDEDRFLTGSDFNVFDLHDGLCEEKEQNGLKVSFCKFSEDKNYEENPLQTIEVSKKSSDFVYLIYQFNGGEKTSERTKLAKSFADKGVDIFIGRGLSETVPFESYKKSLLFYSLGDFISDNKLITELNASSKGIVAGIVANDAEYQLYIMPVDINNGYPSLMSFSDSKKEFLQFISAARGAKSTEIDNEKLLITIKR